MVGHTGVIPAVVEAVETVDRCLGRVVAEVGARPGGVCLVTADHGNAEKMLEPDGSAAHRAHHQPGAADRRRLRGSRCASGGRLADIAPTVLDLLRLPPAGGDGRPQPAGRCPVRKRSAQLGMYAGVQFSAVFRNHPDTLGTSAARSRRPAARTARRRACVRADRAPVPGAAVQLRHPRAVGRPGARRGHVPGGVPARLPGAARLRRRAASSRPGCSRSPSTGWWTSCGRASAAAARRSSWTWSRICTGGRAETDSVEEMDAVWRAIGALTVDLKMALLLRDVVGLQLRRDRRRRWTPRWPRSSGGSTRPARPSPPSCSVRATAAPPPAPAPHRLNRRYRPRPAARPALAGRPASRIARCARSMS